MRIVIYLLVVTFFQNCTGPRKLEKDIQPLFTNVFDTTDKGLSKLINMGGVYLIKSKANTSEVTGSGHKFLFFKDGSFFVATSLIDKRNGKEYWNIWNFPFDEQKYRLTNGGQGYYTISNDTINSFAIDRPRFGIPTPLVRLVFKIIDRTHIQLLGYRKSDGSFVNAENEYYTGEVKKWEKLPPETNWLMYEKWYWKNPEDWEAFMKTKNGK